MANLTGNGGVNWALLQNLGNVTLESEVLSTVANKITLESTSRSKQPTFVLGNMNCKKIEIEDTETNALMKAILLIDGTEQ